MIDPPDIGDLTRRYESGETPTALGRHYGVSRTVVQRWLTEAGVRLRTGSESSRIRMAKMTPAERRANASAAHEARRGQVVTPETRRKFAATRERLSREGSWRRSAGEEAMGRFMDEAGLEYVPEQVVADFYNVDLGCSPVAVEVLGGGWHGSEDRRLHHSKRTHDILNRGWHMVFVWSTNSRPLTREGAHKVIAHVEEARLHPSPVGQYWVLRGDGELVASGGDEGDDFALVPTSVSRPGRRS